jgi:hypothetical protein
MKALLQKLLCEDNGDQVCIAKILALIAFFSFLVYAGFGLVKGQFALKEFAEGITMVLGSSGAVIIGKNLSTR